jgi:hypothetical protein
MSDEPVLCAFCAVGYPPSFCLWEKPGGCLKEAEEDFSSVMPQQGEKEEKVLTDPISTGRKRAAALYKIAPGTECEWAWKKNAGGGIVPIMGCPGRGASHIHHGPDKSTLNNDRDNISIICSTCHVRWHDANDPHYPTPRPSDNSTWLPLGDTIHRLDEMVTADKTEILLHEAAVPPSKREKGLK